MPTTSAPLVQDLLQGETQRAPFRRVVGAAIVVVVILVELTLVAAWFELSASATSLERADDLSVAFTDTRAHFQQLELLAATQDRFDSEEVATQLALLDRQLSIAATRLDDPATTDQLAADIRTVLAAFDDLVQLQREDPEDMATARALAARGRAEAQGAADRTSTITRDLFMQDALAAERTATMVAAVAMVVLVSGAVLVWVVLLRYQRSFDEAWELAAARRDALQASNEQLAALADTRERFVSVLSHELRSPLAVIGAVGETLHRRGDELDDKTRAGILQSLRRQVGRQQRMIDDLLLVARHANARPDPRQTQVDVGALLALVERDGALEGITVSLDAAADTVAWVDGHHLEQVVQNLVRNAEKYGGRTIEITAETDGDDVVILVRDDGDGIRPEEQATLFEPFTQGARDASGGIGLGLSISRELVEANGGSIRYVDDHAGGAAFEVRVPRAATALT